MSNLTAPSAATLIKFVKGEIAADIKRDGVYAAFVAEHNVTLDMINATAASLTEQAYPGVKPSSRAEAKSPEGRANNFRNKVRNGLRRALDTDDKPVKVALRVSLSGEGGGSTVVEKSHPLYEALVALIAGEDA